MATVFLKIVQLNKIDPALILLSLLFVYDIFWVFISPYVFPQGKSVMVEVAMSMDVPNKLSMPTLLLANTGSKGGLLGLGDIVIPGLYLQYLSNLGKVVGTDAYYRAGMIGYTLSFAMCLGVILVFDSAQPVLLYIVPCLFVATYMVASSRGELGKMREIDVNQDGGVTSDQ